MPYEIEDLAVGQLGKKFPVRSALMPRAKFLELVERCMDVTHLPDDLREEIMPVARSMPRFPLGTWIDASRGCGCVAGEFLVASGEIERAALAQLVDEGNEHKITDMLKERPGGLELYTFGNQIDTYIKDELRREDSEYGVHSVEIID